MAFKNLWKSRLRRRRVLGTALGAKRRVRAVKTLRVMIWTAIKNIKKMTKYVSRSVVLLLMVSASRRSRVVTLIYLKTCNTVTVKFGLTLKSTFTDLHPHN